jgi:hypothetical protein
VPVDEVALDLLMLRVGADFAFGLVAAADHEHTFIRFVLYDLKSDNSFTRE